MDDMDLSGLEQFRDRFSGQVFTPSDGGYDDNRTIFNAMIEKRPQVIAQCANTQDVVSAIRFARDHGLEIAVRGGGHGVAGKALTEGGLVIDLRRMNAVSVDPDARTATVAGGATMSHLDRATEPYGLMTTGGRVSTTGVGGFTLGGGNGWLDRKFGLACDNLVSVRIVTSDGAVLTASEGENPDLFWALHGGGGNFGVATSFTFRLHELPAVTAALLLWPPENGPLVFRAYRDFMQSAPDEIGGGALYLTAPEAPFVPADLVGKLAVGVLLVYAGGEAEARPLIAPMLGLGHKGEMIAEMPYAELQCMLDDPPGYRNYWSADYLSTLPDVAIDRFCARARDMVVPSPSQHIILPGGGVAAREGGHWPIAWRTAPWCAHPLGLWARPEDDEQAIQWARDTRADLKPWVTGAVYLNFTGDEGQERVVAAFGQQNYDRMARIKAKYDPENVFHLNHNIKPSGL